MSETVLVIDDDVELVRMVNSCLSEIGLQMEHAGDGLSGVDLALKKEYSLIIIDLGLPRLGGMEVCQRIRQESKAVPILMLTSRADEVDRVLGLESGADDYVIKPFSVRELAARVKAILRRSRVRQKAELMTLEEPVLRFEKLEVDLVKRTVSYDGKALHLTQIEFDLLAYLASRPGVPIPRDQLSEEVWGYHTSRYAATVNTTITRLRAKIEPNPLKPRFILTVRGFGHRFVDPGELERHESF